MDDEETDARIGIDFELVACVRLPWLSKPTPNQAVLSFQTEVAKILYGLHSASQL